MLILNIKQYQETFNQWKMFYYLIWYADNSGDSIILFYIIWPKSNSSLKKSLGKIKYM